jgi:hypothetical protein
MLAQSSVGAQGRAAAAFQDDHTDFEFGWDFGKL